MPSRSQLSVALFLCMLSGLGCAGQRLEVRRLAVVSAAPDAPTKSTKVTMSFEVWDGEKQLLGLPRDAFTVYEDGEPATSESLAESDTGEIRIPVVLVVDTSLSMYQAGSIASLKAAAKKFVTELETAGFEVHLLRFASKVEAAASVDDIPDEFTDEGDRWTSLYAAVDLALSTYPNAVVVAFSDGADNYSQNHGVPDLSAIERFVLPSSTRARNGTPRVIHTVAFGSVYAEKDRQGVGAISALKRLSRNGSFHSATDDGALATVFGDISARIRQIYIYSYLSPNLVGSHSLEVSVAANGKRGRSPEVRYSARQSPGPLSTGRHPRGETLECAELVDNAMKTILRLQTECNSGQLTSCTAAGDILSKRSLGGPAECAPLTEILFKEIEKKHDLAQEARAFYETACLPAGIGAVVSVETSGVLIKTLSSTSLAKAAGLAEGDWIIAINGSSTLGLQLDAVIAVLRGDAGTSVLLKVKHADGSETDVPVVRTARPQDPAACKALGLQPSS